MNVTNVGVEIILTHLVNLYHPLAVILYGSRAVGDETPHSDWDLYLIIDQTEKGFSGQQTTMFMDQSLDIVFFTHEVDTVNISAEFDNTLLSARVILDPQGLGQKLIDRANAKYLSGRNLSPEEIESRRAYLLRLLGRLEDHKEYPPLFFMRSSQLYREAIKAWYEVLHNRWQAFLSQALKEIKVADPVFYSLLETIHNPGSNDNKLVAARSILDQLFPSDQK